jgi:hypothetical protein
LAHSTQRHSIIFISTRENDADWCNMTSGASPWELRLSKQRGDKLKLNL